MFDMGKTGVVMGGMWAKRNRGFPKGLIAGQGPILQGQGFFTVDIKGTGNGPFPMLPGWLEYGLMQ